MVIQPTLETQLGRISYRNRSSKCISTCASILLQRKLHTHLHALVHPSYSKTQRTCVYGAGTLTDILMPDRDFYAYL